MKRVLTLCWLAAASSCVERIDFDAPWTPEERAIIASLALPSELKPRPSTRNPYADDPRAAALGRVLFFDTGLSEDGSLACASCHQPQHYFQDGQRRARGRHKATMPRNTPSVMGAAHAAFLNWDGSKDSLWSQALGPLSDPRELGASPEHVALHMASEHREAYEAIFGPLPPQPEHDVMLNVARALEAYQRTLWPQPAPFDAYAKALAEGDEDGGGHLSPGARRGLRLFIGRGGCVDCHHGPLFTDGEFHSLGLPRPEGTLGDDRGRADGLRALLADPHRCQGIEDCGALPYLDPDFEDHQGAFRTPSLRNVAETGPYMHGGQLLTLQEVVELYKRLPGQARVGHRDLMLKKLGSSFPTRDMVLFLRALTGPLPEHAAPPPSAEAAISVP